VLPIQQILEAQNELKLKTDSDILPPCLILNELNTSRCCRVDSTKWLTPVTCLCYHGNCRLLTSSTWPRYERLNRQVGQSISEFEWAKWRHQCWRTVIHRRRPFITLSPQTISLAHSCDYLLIGLVSRSTSAAQLSCQDLFVYMHSTLWQWNQSLRLGSPCDCKQLTTSELMPVCRVCAWARPWNVG